jgi:WD40 repeat protein
VWEITKDGAREVLSLSAQDMASGVLAVFSPDGKRVMTGDAQIRSVKIWDVSRTGDAEWANLPSVPGDLGGVAFTPDGRRVIASNGDGSVTLWDAEAGKRSETIGRPQSSSGTSGGILAIDVSSDGRLIAAAGPTAKAWNAETGIEVSTVRSDGGVEDLDWSPDGSLLATAGSGGLIKIVDRSGKEMAALREDPSFRLSAVQFSPDGELLATARIPPTAPAGPAVAQVKIWDWRRGAVVRTISVPAEGLAFDPTGTRFATADVRGLVEIWDVGRGRRVATLRGHSGAVNDVAFSPDGSVIASASTDGTVRLWDPESGAELLVLRGHQTTVWDLAFSPDGSKLASFSPDRTVRVWALDLDDLIDIAKRELTRSLTNEECQHYLHVDRCREQ